MNNRRFHVLTGLALLIAATVAASWFFNPAPQTPRHADIILPLDLLCDLQQGPCALPVPGAGRLLFSIEPRPIQPLETLRISTVTEGFQAREVGVELRGIDMSMGITRISLQKTKEGHFDGMGQLPVCVRSRMDWRAEVWLQTKEIGVVVAPFRFTTYTRPR